jgi:AcrR family transcriptional regulator
MSGEHPATVGAEAGQAAQARVVKRRPKNRKSQIASSAATAFGSHGYHAVSMEDIAATLDISAAALYRHYPSKYALFRETVLRLGGLLEQAAATPPELADADAETRLNALLRTLVTLTIANRQSGGLYRWQSRYLKGDDQRLLREQVRTVTRAVRDLIQELRPDDDPEDLYILAAGAINVIGSIVDHHAALPAKQIESLLTAAARRVLAAQLPPADATAAAAAAVPEIPLSFKHEVLLKQAIILFYQRGYPEVTIEEIAASAGMPASGVYRYFHSKSDILAAAFRRAAERVSAAIAPAVAASDGPEQALGLLIEQYVAGAFDESELTFVYFAEIGNVAPADRTVLRNIQRLNVEEWAKLLVQARPRLSPAEARFLVHAALGLVVGLGRYFKFHDTPSNQARIRALMRVTLLG